ncbi:hypothetical protein [Treponema sp. J25]|uniref:hypothetical protein n=1 Tax=Treponema sp. J25 TaxID=2094121 RepID=UPI0010477B64|nr:hypothetical protein [Treponema sp. J25]TCW60160.1 hypothetical protein C5O22_12750 [Treponema sp. J25]
MTQSLNIEKYTNIYIACPANIASGGPELLHQLGYELANLGFATYMFYYNSNENVYPVHEAYLCYGNKFVNEIEDVKKNILIVPETYTQLIYNYKYIQKVIWWLSVDNYYNFLKSNSKIKKNIKIFLYKLGFFPKEKIYRFSKNENILHLVQSEYAKQMLKNKGVDSLFLGDYLNYYFIQKQENNTNPKKENIVVYNPKKGKEFTNLIIEKAKDIKFVSIENMTREEVADLLSRAKVYIDFGNHPGKDRIPREAAILGCCVITGKDGSAKFYEDIPIGNNFKFDANKKNIPLIIKKIKSCFENYETITKEFEYYREIIRNERTKFLDDLKNIFKVNV